MSTYSVEDIIDKALQQPEKARARIAERLIASLDHTVDTDIEIAWQEEMARRLKEIDSGAVKCIPWEEARDRLHKNANAQLNTIA